MGERDLSSDERFTTHALRKANEDAADEVVAAWTRSQDRWELADLLQSHGIAAAAVANLRDTLEVDPHLRHHYQRVRQPSDPEAEIVTVGEAIRFSGVKRPLERAPEPGEHSRYVLEELLGLSEEEIREIVVSP